MSERITAANLDEVIKRNEVIEEQMKQSASLIWSKYNPMQINSPIQLALQILRPHGLIQLPIDNRYLSGAIFVRDGKRIPLINTALPRANQYFTAWHEIYHVSVDEIVTFLRISHSFIRLICRNSCPVPNLFESKACCTKL